MFLLHFSYYLKGLFLLPLSIVVFSLFIVYGIFEYLVLGIIGLFHYSLAIKFYNHSLNLSLSIDQLANASIHGNIDQTISGRLGYAIHHKKNDNKLYAIICKILNIFFKQDSHCLDAIEYDRL